MKRNFILLTLFMIFSSIMFGQNQNHWNTDMTLYPNNMSLQAMVLLDGEELRGENIELAAFCGEELRGNNRPQQIIATDPETNESIDVYIVFLTIYGDDGDELYFRFYDHDTQVEFEMPSNETVVFVTNDTQGSIFAPLLITFTTPADDPTFIGEGSWNDASNWKNQTLPSADDNVIIDGTAAIKEGSDVTVFSLTINENKSLTVENGGILTVTATITNTVESLILEDGGQIYQTNDNVPFTFRKNIVNPDETWGELDKTGWQFISSPIQNAPMSDFAPSNGDYDLYTYDGTLSNQWYNFKKATSYSFDDGMEGWTSKDADGDGYGWNYSEEGYLYSESYTEDGDELAPENYLYSPSLKVSDVGSLFRFKVSSLDDMYMDYCGVFVSTDGGNSFEPIEGQSWWIGEGIYENEQSEWYEKTVDLSAYSGSINIAICHYNMEDGAGYQLLIDDIQFLRTGGDFEVGVGYMVSYQNETVAEFKGLMNNEASYKINANYNKNNLLMNYNLFGNPYPYNLNWETDVKLIGVNDGYAMIKQDGGYIYKTDGEIKAGDAFMINSNSGRSHNITMGKGVNSSKVYSDDNTSISIMAEGRYGTDNIVIRMGNEERTSFPKLINFNNKIANIYLKENDTIYGIYDYDNNVKEIPLYFDAKEIGNYTFTFDIKGDIEELYLIDKMTGEEINVVLENEYDFTATSNERDDRFVLTTTIGYGNHEENFVFVNNDNLHINAEGTIQIIDVMGRIVMTEESHNGMIDISGLESAAYVVRCLNKNEVKTQKIVVL